MLSYVEGAPRRNQGPGLARGSVRARLCQLSLCPTYILSPIHSVHTLCPHFCTPAPLPSSVPFSLATT